MELKTYEKVLSMVVCKYDRELISSYYHPIEDKQRKHQKELVEEITKFNNDFYNYNRDFCFTIKYFEWMDWYSTPNIKRYREMSNIVLDKVFGLKNPKYYKY